MLLQDSWAGRHAYTIGALMVAAITAFGFIAAPILHVANLDALYLLAVLCTGLTGGRRPAMFIAVLSTVAFDYCFIPPRYSFHVTDLPYLVTLIVFVLVALATSTLATRAGQLTAEQAARAEAEARSQAKDEILRRISHELRSPLTGVLGWAQQLDRAAGDPERLARSLSGLRHSGELLARLVDDLLNASRVSSGKLTVRLAPISLASTISRVVDDMTLVAAERHVSVQSDIGPVGEVMGDEHRLEQIARNLLSNAINFTQPGGRITVRLGRTESGCALVISDTGAGISADFLPHVFERFTQAESAKGQGGLGLGMAITKYLVEAHGGTIDVASDGPGRGATFTVSLPALVLQTAPEASVRLERPAPAQHSSPA